MADYRKRLIEKLHEHGCEYVRAANGSHELWQSPINKRRFVVQNDLSSRVTANSILKQAGIAEKL